MEFAVIGANGSGKSSIFDAMTHALFGGRAKSGKDTGLNDLKSLVSKQIQSQYKNNLESITKESIMDQIEKIHDITGKVKPNV